MVQLVLEEVVGIDLKLNMFHQVSQHFCLYRLGRPIRQTLPDLLQTFLQCIRFQTAIFIPTVVLVLVLQKFFVKAVPHTDTSQNISVSI